MKILVCGGRNYRAREKVFAGMDTCAKVWAVTHVIHGAAEGADMLAGQWARERGMQEVRCYANWHKYDRAAGSMRNQRMLELRPDAVVAFPGAIGTAHMVRIAREAGVYVHFPYGESL